MKMLINYSCNHVHGQTNGWIDGCRQKHHPLYCSKIQIKKHSRIRCGLSLCWSEYRPEVYNVCTSSQSAWASLTAAWWSILPCNNSPHVRQQFIPDRITVNYNLRTRPHNNTSTPKTSDLSEYNFLIRNLYNLLLYYKHVDPLSPSVIALVRRLSEVLCGTYAGNVVTCIAVFIETA